ncbi:MAG: C40 family peptidase [Chitinophagales bacterium]|nr:C40 family peptidase [Chitinophagales bacterium]
MKKTALSLFICVFLLNNNAKSETIFEYVTSICTKYNIDGASFINFFQNAGIDIAAIDNYDMYVDVFKWLNTPYRYGGKTEYGIDCSHYVFKIQSEQEAYYTSSQLANITDFVAKEDLQEGDLVFFNTRGSGVSHVGLYLQNGKFTHASSSQGVTISSLNDKYWAARYVKAGRITNVKEPANPKPAQFQQKNTKDTDVIETINLYKQK